MIGPGCNFISEVSLHQKQKRRLKSSGVVPLFDLPRVAAGLANRLFVVFHLRLALVLADEQPEAAGADDEQRSADAPKAPTALCTEAVLND